MYNTLVCNIYLSSQDIISIFTQKKGDYELHSHLNCEIMIYEKANFQKIRK